MDEYINLLPSGLIFGSRVWYYYCMPQSTEQEKTMLREPVKKRLGGTLAKRSPFERLAMLQRNADALVGNWRGKNDGTHIRKTFGSSAEK